MAAAVDWGLAFLLPAKDGPWPLSCCGFEMGREHLRKAMCPALHQVKDRLLHSKYVDVLPAA